MTSAQMSSSELEEASVASPWRGLSHLMKMKMALR